jgi:hypothetical protein
LPRPLHAEILTRHPLDPCLGGPSALLKLQAPPIHVQFVALGLHRDPAGPMGVAVRAPVATGSVVDLVCEVGTETSAEELNAATKNVASTTLTELDWHNSKLIEGEVPDGVRALKHEDGPELQVHGSPTLVQSLIQSPGAGDGVFKTAETYLHPQAFA